MRSPRPCGCGDVRRRGWATCRGAELVVDLRLRYHVEIRGERPRGADRRGCRARARERLALVELLAKNNVGARTPQKETTTTQVPESDACSHVHASSNMHASVRSQTH